MIFVNTSFGQKQSKYTQIDFEKNKVFKEVYNLWSSKGNWFSNSMDSDSISYFVDDRNYKGIVNYGVTFHSKSYRTFNFVEHLSMCFLKVEISKCVYNPIDKTIDIEGFVSGNNNWGSNEFIKSKKIKTYIDLFLGEKTDTIKNCYLGRTMNKDSVDIKLNNKKADEFTVIDKFPAFYFKNYIHNRMLLGNRQPFKIRGKVANNTLLAFGSGQFYSEIFDLGSMIHNLKNTEQKTIKKEEFDCRALISNNKLIVDIEKEEAKKKEITYYTYTKNAENYILGRQFGKAKDEYNLLAQNYPVLFARDINNAIRCAILSRDIKAAFCWSEKLAYKGIELPYFNAKIFNGLRKNPEWKNFSIKYDSISKATKLKWNLPLKKELDNLLNEDQAEYGLENRKSPKILYETTEKITDRLIDLLKKEGFPSEEKIGSHIIKDTVLISFPDFNVLILHALQKSQKNLKALNELLDKSSKNLEYDQKRNFNNTIGYGSCFRIYKGNLYNSKACSQNNSLEVRKISFKFNNPNGFIMDYGNYVIEANDSKDPKAVDNYYKENYNLIMKLTDDWEFYEKY